MTNPFGCLFGILIAALAFVFIAALSMVKKIKDTLASMFSPKGKRQQSPRDSYGTTGSGQRGTSSPHSSSRGHKKIFEDNEGEYVDFEEIK